MSNHAPAISHITLGTNDLQRAAHFYDAVLGCLGFTRATKPEGKPLMYAKSGEMPYVYLYPPFDGQPASCGNGTHIAFTAHSRAAVDEFHAMALTFGGQDEGKPGIRAHYADNYYAAYARDPDGNKLQAVCYSEA
jgi:catechol 2,3-dioxygenase-like lactoylglutathione lyase family enzyme